MESTPLRKIHLREFKAISRAISSYDDLRLLIRHMTERICRSLQVKGCSILLYDEREKQLFHVASFGISDAYLSKGPLFVDNQYRAFITGEPVLVEDLQKDPRIKYPDEAAREGIVAMLSLPIKRHQAAIGLIRIYHSEPWHLHEDDLDSFCMLADHLGLVIECNGLRNFVDKVKHAMEILPLRLSQ